MFFSTVFVNRVDRLCLLNWLSRSIALLELLFEQTLLEVCASHTLHHRQLQLALANSDEDPEGLIDYRSVAPHLSKLLLKSQASCLCLSIGCWHLSPTARVSNFTTGHLIM